MKILQSFASQTGQIALLIDPEKTKSREQINPLIEKANFAKIDFIFVGGSTVTRKELEQCVELIRVQTKIPIVLFPGSSNQLSDKADALLFLNLISGRNPDFLIGHQVACAEEVFHMDIEVLPTSYLLIDGGKLSSVAYISQTTPIPREQESIAVKTAIAGYLMGQQITYFDAGSGAIHSVPSTLIEKTRQHLSTPIIVGGGIRDTQTIQELSRAGANVLVIGNKIEEDIHFLLDLADYQKHKV